MTTPRIYITGMGAVSPNGTSIPNFFDHTVRGVSGLQTINRFDPGSLSSKVAGLVDDFDETDWVDESDQKNLSRSVALEDAATTEALKRAGLTEFPDPHRIGVVIGSGGGPVDFTEEQYRWYFTGDGQPSVYNVPSSTIGNLASELSMRHGILGPSHLVSTGCTSSSDAYGHALMMLRSGRVDCVICGGVDSPVTPGIINGFEKMNVISTDWNDQPHRASRPFDHQRDGFVLAEGSWITVLETRDHLKSRGGPEPLARLEGYGSTCDAHHRVRMKEDGSIGQKAIDKALEDAECEAGDVDYIQAHGTGTELNDRVETTIFKKSFDACPPISSIKSMIGHPQGASGAAGLVTGVLAMRSAVLPPTINLDNPDPECDLFYVPHEAISRPADTVLVNCLGFGSRNSAMILETP